MNILKRNIGFFILILVVAILLTGCLTDVKETKVTGKIIAVDVAGVPAAPFVIVAFDDGQSVSPIDMRNFASLSNYLGKNVTVVFGPAKDNGLWYDVKSIVKEDS